MNFQIFINLLSILYNFLFYFIDLKKIISTAYSHEHFCIFAKEKKKKKGDSVPTFNMSNLGRPLSSSIEQTLKYIHNSGTSNL